MNYKLPQNHKPFDPSQLHVITVITNPQRFGTRYDLYRGFEKHAKDQGVTLWTVEAAFGDRPHEITSHEDPHHLQFRTRSEIWHKENLINVGIQHLPRDWEYVAWVDADITFARPDWAVETIHQLQHYDIVQMFSRAMDMSPQHEVFAVHKGMGWSYVTGKNPPALGSNGYAYGFWHPGFAWAARREAIDHLGGLIDWAILGAADHHMAHALVGRVDRTFPSRAAGEYCKSLMRWQERAEKHLRRNVGYVDGTIMHHWHGKKKDRRYIERWDILLDNHFNPELDLKKDWQGIWQLTDRSIGLRDGIRQYFKQRNEDSIDCDESVM